MERRWRIGMSGFWAANLLSLVFIGTTLARQFSAGSEITKNIDVSAITADTIRLSAENNPFEHVMYFAGGEFQITDEKLINYHIHLDIEKAAKGQESFELIQKNFSRGASLNEANGLAQRVEFPILSDESGITFPQNFIIRKGNKWRNQTIDITLKVPEGKSVQFDDPNGAVYDLLSHVKIDDPNDFRIRNNRAEIWTMGEGGLACSSCISDEDELSYQDFSKLKIDGKIKVNIERGDRFKISLNGRKHYTEQVNILQMEETLLVSTDLKHTNSPIRLFITMPNLSSIITENTDDVRIEGFKEPTLSMSSKGRYEVKAFIDVDSLMLTQVGRNAVDIRGNCNYLNANLKERAKLDAEKISIREVDISATESSKASLAVIETVRQQSDQRSKITIEGEPNIVIQQQ